MKFRNIWGVFDWDGDWSVHSDLWTEDMIKKIKPDLDDKFSFWISMKHFL